MQLNSSRFIGMYLSNPSAAQVEISPFYNSTTDSLLKLKIIGGNLDIYFFGGSSFQVVAQQYHSVVGRPKLLPSWAHGFFVRSLAFYDPLLIIAAVN